jgi:hypothetical protein
MRPHTRAATSPTALSGADRRLAQITRTWS